MSTINTNHILYLDLEPFNFDKDQKRIKEIGVVIDDFQQKYTSPGKLFEQLKSYKPVFLCGHNLIKFDYHYLTETESPRTCRRVRDHCLCRFSW